MVNIPNPLGLQWYEHPSLPAPARALSKARDDLREHNLFEQDGMRPEPPAGDPPPTWSGPARPTAPTTTWAAR